MQSLVQDNENRIRKGHQQFLDVFYSQQLKSCPSVSLPSSFPPLLQPPSSSLSPLTFSLSLFPFPLPLLSLFLPPPLSFPAQLFSPSPLLLLLTLPLPLPFPPSLFLLPSFLFFTYLSLSGQNEVLCPSMSLLGSHLSHKQPHDWQTCQSK